MRKRKELIRRKNAFVALGVKLQHGGRISQEKKVKTKRQSWILVIKPIIENFIARAPWWGAIVNFVMA